MNIHRILVLAVALLGSRVAQADASGFDEPAPAPPAPPPAQAQAKVTVEASLPAPYTPLPPGVPADRPTPAAKPEESLRDRRLLHGMRLGYLFVNEYDKKLEGLGGQSLKDRVNLRSPHQFLVGYEAFYRMMGHSWLNVLLVGNVMVGGLEQSRFFPSANALLGFEIDNSFQLGVGVNVTPLKGSEAHTIVAAGWTPRVGGFYVPVHAFFVPDVDGAHRMGITTGVTF